MYKKEIFWFNDTYFFLYYTDYLNHTFTIILYAKAQNQILASILEKNKFLDVIYKKKK